MKRLLFLAFSLLIAATLTIAFGPTANAAPVALNTKVQCGGYFVYSVSYGPHPGDKGTEYKVEPSGTARTFNIGMWDDIWRCLPNEKSKYSKSQLSSMEKQLRCHVWWSLGVPGTKYWTGGATWDLESGRSNISTWKIYSFPHFLGHKCNWK